MTDTQSAPKLKIIQAIITDLIPYAYNNKDHTKTVRSIMESIEQNWFYNPIQINEDNIIINGHGRRLAMKKLWYETIPAIIISWMPEEQQKLCRVIDNLTASYSKYDMENLTKEIEDSPDEFLRKLTKEVFKGFMFIDETTKELIEDVVPNIKKLWIIKHWDVVKLWDHTIMCWDSTKQEDTRKLMNWIKADCVRTDPPYNINYKGHAEATKEWIMNDKMDSGAFKQFLTDAFANMITHTKAEAWTYIYHNHKEQSTFQEALEWSWYEIKSQIIRNKPSLWLGGGHYRPKHEIFFYCAKKWEQPEFYGDRSQSSVRDIMKSKNDAQMLAILRKAKEAEKDGKTTIRSVRRDNVQEYIHPTQKPVQLCQIALANSSKTDDIVLDLFLWSGVTVITCEKLNRVCYGMELDPHFIETIIERYVLYTEQKDISINGERKSREERKQIASKNKKTKQVSTNKKTETQKK